jgi:hypothetical protein
LIKEGRRRKKKDEHEQRVSGGRFSPVSHGFEKQVTSGPPIIKPYELETPRLTPYI